MNFVSLLEKKGTLLFYLYRHIVTAAKADASSQNIFHRFRYVF